MPLKFSSSVFLNKKPNKYVNKNKRVVSVRLKYVAALNKRNPFTMSLCWINRRDLVW